MALPAQIAVSFDFSNGATFGYNGFVIGDPKYGILGTNTLGDSNSPEPVIDLTPNVYQIWISRGRNLQRDNMKLDNAQFVSSIHCHTSTHKTHPALTSANLFHCVRCAFQPQLPRLKSIYSLDMSFHTITPIQRINAFDIVTGKDRKSTRLNSSHRL